MSYPTASYQCVNVEAHGAFLKIWLRPPDQHIVDKTLQLLSPSLDQGTGASENGTFLVDQQVSFHYCRFKITDKHFLI